MKKKTVKAKFIGTDGSMGFRYDTNYVLVLSTDSETSRITIKAEGSKGLTCVYDNFVLFLNNWDNIDTTTV